MVRPAQSEDAAVVAELYLKSRKNCVSFAPLAHSDQEVRTWIRDTLIPAGGTYVCVAGMTIVGFVSVSTRDGFSWIDQLYVDPAHMRVGHGDRLLSFAKKLLASTIRLYTFQANVAAIEFYQRSAFISVEVSDGSKNEERCPDVLMEWVGPDA